MDVREKLVEIIQNSVGGCARHWAEVIADGLIANGVTVQNKTETSDELLQQLRNAPLTVLYEEPTIEVVQEWISVKDRLPDTAERVLVCKTWNGRVYKPEYGYYQDFPNQKGCWYVLTEEGYYPQREVTHWMPLPQPPKGE